MNFTYAWGDAEKACLINRVGDSTFTIPCETANSDYQAFLRWCEEGNEPLPYVAPTVIDGITDLAQAKTVASDSVRSTAYSLLLPTDWVVTREMETGTPAPADITTYRAAVRSAADEKVATIEGKQKLSTLADYLRSAEFADPE